MLKTMKQNNDIIITVEDDGVGFDMKELKKDKSIGLKNIAFRLEYMLNGKMEIESKVNEGTKVTITIPEDIKNNY